MNKKSTLYASALTMLSLFVLLSVIPVFWQRGFLTFVPGAGLGLQLMHWLGVLAAPLTRILIGIVLLSIAFQCFKGRLRVPSSRAAQVGRVLANIGLFTGFMFWLWQLWVRSMGPGASIFAMFGPFNFWMSFLYAGVALVEGSRVLGLTCDVQRSETCWLNTERLAD